MMVNMLCGLYLKKSHSKRDSLYRLYIKEIHHLK